MIVWREDKDSSGVRPTCMGLGRSSQHMSHRGVGVYRRSSQLEVSKHTCTPTHKPLQLCRLDRPFGRAREKKPHLFCQIRLSVLTAVRRSDLFFYYAACPYFLSQPCEKASFHSELLLPVHPWRFLRPFTAVMVSHCGPLPAPGLLCCIQPAGVARSTRPLRLHRDPTVWERSQLNGWLSKNGSAC